MSRPRPPRRVAPGRRPALAARGTAERGAASLAEILVAIAIIGIAFSGILGGLASVALGSRLHRERSELQVVLGSAAEAVRDPAAAPHVTCAAATEATYLAAARAIALPAGWTASSTVDITAVRYWDGTGFGATCYDTVPLGNLLRLQLVTVEVTSPDGRTSESTNVVKSP